MLPDRSKRYAGVDGQIPRLVLATNWHLMLIALLILALLISVFPRKALVERLYQQETLDELTLSYVQNLYHADPGNADAALLLARSQQDVMDIETMESVLWRLVSKGMPHQRIEAVSLLARAYQNQLRQRPDAKRTSRANSRLIELIQLAKTIDLPADLTLAFATKAFEMNLTETGLIYFNKLHVDQPARVLEKYADLALGEGHYAAAAAYYFLARKDAPSLEEARRLFVTGVETLMAASLFTQAMVAARLHIGNLADDPQTLRFLSRTALAAGDTNLAADYARKLVFENRQVPP